jgi:hypothetical protein
MDAKEDCEARAALEGSSWLSTLVKSSDYEQYETSWSQSPDRWEGYKSHYVIGQLSPFRFHMAKTGKDEATSLVWAVYFGAYSTNGGGVIQGGAISSVFDVGTAQLGTQMFSGELGGSFGTTKSITVKFKRPGPLKKVLRLDVKATDTSKVDIGLMTVEAVLFDGDTVIAESSAEMVDPARRQAWRQKQNSGKRSRL